MDSLAVIASTFHVIRLIFLWQVRRPLGWEMATVNDSLISTWVKETIFVDMVMFTLGGLTCNALMQSVVKSASGAQIYQSFEFRGKMVDPTKALKLYRVFVLFGTVGFYSYWGLTSHLSITDFNAGIKSISVTQ